MGEKKKLIQIKNKPYSIYIVSTKKEMSFLINKLNGLIRIKAFSFKKSCDLLNITYLYQYKKIEFLKKIYLYYHYYYFLDNFSDYL